MSDTPTIREQLQAEIERLKKAPAMPDTVLPELKKNQIFYCGYCDNDQVKPERYELDYIAVTDSKGNTIFKKTMMDYRSDCCGKEIMILDTVTDDEVPWPE